MNMPSHLAAGAVFTSMLLLLVSCANPIEENDPVDVQLSSSALNYSGCKTVTANKTSSNYLDRIGPYSAADYGSNGGPACNGYVADVTSLQSDFVHFSMDVSPQSGSNCSGIYVYPAVYKKSSTGWQQLSTSAVLTGGSLPIETGYRCVFEMTFSGANTPAMVKGGDYRFAIGTTPKSGFVLWSNRRAGITTVPAKAATAYKTSPYGLGPLPVDRWVTWISTGVKAFASAPQSDLRGGLQPPDSIDGTGTITYSSEDYTRFRYPFDQKVSAVVIYGFFGLEAQRVLAVAQGNVNGEAMTQFRLGGPQPLYGIVRNGRLSFQDNVGNPVTSGEPITAFITILYRYSQDMKAAGLPLSCALETISAVAGVATCIGGALILAGAPVVLPAEGLTLAGTCLGAIASVGVAIQCFDDPVRNPPAPVPNRDPEPDVVPKPLPPDPNAPPQPIPPPGLYPVYMEPAIQYEGEPCIEAGEDMCAKWQAIFNRKTVCMAPDPEKSKNFPDYYPPGPRCHMFFVHWSDGSVTLLPP